MASLAPSVIKQLTRELLDLQEKPCDGIRVTLNEQDVTDVQAELDGPAGTPFEGGVFRLKLCIGSEFPNVAPKGLFLTKIWHPNVSKAGEICVNVLKRDWKPDMGLRHVLLVIRCLLIEPFPESALNEEAGMALLDNYEEYCKYARLMTSLHALPSKRPHGPLTASGANSAAPSEAGTPVEGSPAVKKAKPAGLGRTTSNAQLKAKKSLKRL